MKKLHTLLLFFLLSAPLFAQVPAGTDPGAYINAKLKILGSGSTLYPRTDSLKLAALSVSGATSGTGLQGQITALQGTKLDASVYTGFAASNAIALAAITSNISSNSTTLGAILTAYNAFTLAQATVDVNQNTAIAGKLPNSFSATQAGVDAGQNTAIAAKEPTITTGSTSQYIRGDKSLATLNADAVPDGSTNKAYTATEKTKLAGIASGATANSPDATLLNRSNHTGTQPFSTITGIATPVQIGTGTPSAGKYVDGATGVWTTLPSSGTGGGSSSTTIDTTSIIAARTNPPMLFSQLTGFYKKKTIRVLLGGTSIQNNNGSALKQFVAGMQSQFGWSGNTTQHMGILGGGYSAPYLGWLKQSSATFAFYRLRGDNTASAISFSQYMKRYVLRYSKDTGGGDFTVAIDGVVSATLSCSGTQAFAQEYVYNFSTPGIHTVTINPPASGYAYLETQDFCLDNPGLHIMDATLGGSSVSNFFTPPTPSAPAIAAVTPVGMNGLNSLYNNTSTNFKPDVAFFGWHVNDVNTPYATYKAAVDSVVRACYLNAIQLVIIVEPAGHFALPVDGGYNAYNAMRTLLLSYRKKPNVTVIDWNARIGFAGAGTDLAELTRLAYRFYNVTSLNAAADTYGGDFIHPNDLGNAIGAEALYEATGINPSGRQGDGAATVADFDKKRTEYVTPTVPGYQTTYTGLTGLPRSFSNTLGVTNTYRNIGYSTDNVGLIGPLWHSMEEINYFPAVNDYIATAGTSDTYGAYRTLSSYGTYMTSPPSNFTVNPVATTLTMIVGPGAWSVQIRDYNNTVYIPVVTQGVSATPAAGPGGINYTNSPQVVHVSLDSYGANMFFTISGKVYGVYLTPTNFACIPEKRWDQARLLKPGARMVGDLAYSKVILNQTYYEAINGKTIEKIAIGQIYKPLSSTVSAISANNWYGLYRLQNRSAVDNKVLTLTGTLTDDGYIPWIGGNSQSTNASPKFLYTTMAGSTSALTYTVSGEIWTNGIFDGLRIVLYNAGSNTYYSLNADGTWTNQGSNSNAGTNLIGATGHLGGRPIAFTFVMPDSTVVPSGGIQLRVYPGTQGNFFPWLLCEGSSATN